MEAAQKASEPYVELRADTPQGADLFLTITNTCDEPPESDGAGGYLTRKPNKQRHGMGTKSVRSVLRKYGGILKQHYNKEAGLFHTTVVIRKKKES